MSDTTYGPGPIKCQECGQKKFDTIEKGHLQSTNCTGEVDDVNEYREKYPKEPTRSIEMRDKIVDALTVDQ